MTIIVYRLKNMNGEIRAIEWDRWENGRFSGRLRGSLEMTRDQVIDRWNRGHWRTSEI